MAAPTLAPQRPPTTGIRPRSERRLSEVTKKLAYPRSRIVSSEWNHISNVVCREQMGIEFDGWQNGLGRLLLARDAEGIIVHTVGGFHLSAMRQIGKCIDALTDLLTVNRGWITIADVRVGDLVFHPSGHPTMVTSLSPIWLNHRCYEVTMTDGRRIVTDADHLWTVRDKRLGGAPWRNATTEEMYEGGLSRALSGSRSVVTDGKHYQTTECRFTLPQQHALESLRAIDPLIDPYLLGAWLGNGNSHGCVLWSGREDVDHWTGSLTALGLDYVKRLNVTDSGSAWALGIQQGKRGQRNPFIGKLRQLNLVDNKHIPAEYLTASTEQRLALLQGLLDTDGHITTKGVIEFCSVTRDLADGALFLARSLGWRATLREDKAKLNGQDYGPRYRITFTPKASDTHTPFRLQRKIDRIGKTDGGKGRFTVSIKSIEPVATRPVRCIKVASPDGLFLAGRDLIPTHNTYFFAGAFFGMSVKYPGLLTIWSAHHSKTHEETFQSMQAFATRTMVKPFIKRVLTGSGDEAVEFHNGSRILFGARERGFGRGVPGVDVLMSDEGQILSERAMQNMLATLNTSKIGLHVYAGTPPKPEDNSEQWMRSREEAWVDGPDGPPIVETEDLVWAEIGAQNGCDLGDRNQWLFNPSYPHRTPVQAFMRLRRKLNDDGWRREGLGLYDEDGESDFNITRWETLTVTADEPERAIIVLDASPDGRWSSIGVASDLPLDSVSDEDRTLVMVKSYPGTKGVVSAVEKMMEDHDIVEVWVTQAGKVFETDLSKAMIEYDKLTQSDLAAAYGNLMKAIKHGTVAHVDQKELTFALANAKSRFLQTGEVRSFDRREDKSDPDIDISPAVAMAGALYKWGMAEDPLPLIM